MPTLFRNNLVFANNKRQNIEYRLFATGSAKLKTGSLAIAYSSLYNKFIADLPTLNNSTTPKYYASESKASISSDYLIYQNSRIIYLQNLDQFIAETLPANIRQNETSSNTQLLSTKYYASESKASVSSNYLIYQNDRTIYLQNLDQFIAESLPPILRQNETSSNVELLSTKYYASESKTSVSSNNLIYQNSRTIYLQNLDQFIVETLPITRQNETSSNTQTLSTKYYASESKASVSSDYLIYQNDRSIYLQNSDIFTIEV